MKKAQQGIIIGVLIGIIVIGVIGFLIYSGNVKMSSYVVKDSEENINDKNCREVKTPYEIIETYIDKEPYQGFEDVEVNLKYEKSGHSRKSYSELFNVKEKGIVNIKNVDGETGYFKIKMNFRTLDDGTVSKTTSGYVQPGETKEFYIYYDVDADEEVSFTYEVTPGTKTITKPVTKNKSVEKTRIVTKYKTETVCE